MEEKRSAAPAASSAIARGALRPTEDGYGTRAPAEERCSALSGHTLRGAWSRGLAVVVLVLKAGASGDAIGACPNWATIVASPGKPTCHL